MIKQLIHVYEFLNFGEDKYYIDFFAYKIIIKNHVDFLFGIAKKLIH